MITHFATYTVNKAILFDESELFNFFTGCSGDGKSTMIDTFKSMGYATMPEADRIVVKEQMTT